MGNIRISIIITVHNSLNYVKKCLKSVLKYFDFSLGEVILADNCSNDKTQKYLETIALKNSRIKLIKNPQDIGFLKNCNKAFNYTEGEIVVFLNSDTEIGKDFCFKILTCFESDSQIVTASPVSSNSALHWIPQIYGTNKMNKKLSTRNPVYPDVFNSEGFCFCIRRDYILKAGLFDEIYSPGYCEEVDFCLRAKRDGGRCVLIDNMYVKHARHKTFGTTRNYYLSKHNKILYERWKDTFQNSSPEFVLKNTITSCFNRYERFLIYKIYKISEFIKNTRIFNLKNFFRTLSNHGKRVVYTCITGKCDKFPPLLTKIDPETDYICFTDNKFLLKLRKFGEWRISSLKFSRLDDTRNSRWHKTHPHVLFPDRDESIWIDGNIDILTDYIYNIKDFDKILIPKHFLRDDIYEEINALRGSSKEEQENLDKINHFLKEQGFPEHYGLNETNIIIRSHLETAQIMEEWWEIIEKYSKRDQLSLSYVLWKNNINVEDISIPNARIDSLNFRFFPH